MELRLENILYVLGGRVSYGGVTGVVYSLDGSGG